MYFEKAGAKNISRERDQDSLTQNRLSADFIYFQRKPQVSCFLINKIIYINFITKNLPAENYP